MSQRRVRVFSFDLDETLTYNGNSWNTVLNGVGEYHEEYATKWYSGQYSRYEEFLDDTIKHLLGIPFKRFEDACIGAEKTLRPGMVPALLRLKQSRPDALIVIVSGGLEIYAKRIVQYLNEEAAKLAGDAGVPGGVLIDQILCNDLTFSGTNGESASDSVCTGYNGLFIEKDEILAPWVKERLGIDSAECAVHIGDAFNDQPAVYCCAGGVCMPHGNPQLREHAFISIDDDTPFDSVADIMVDSLLELASAFERGEKVKRDDCPRMFDRKSRASKSLVTGSLLESVRSSSEGINID